MKTRILCMLVAVAMAVSCSDKSTDSTISIKLADIDPDNIPLESTWIITDDNSTAQTGVRVITNWDLDKLYTNTQTGDFYYLYQALLKADSQGRKVSLEFPNLDSLPSGALSDVTQCPTDDPIKVKGFQTSTAIQNLTLAKATKVGQFACVSKESMLYLKMPNVVEIADFAFDYTNFTTDGSYELASLKSLGRCAINQSWIGKLSLPELNSIETYTLQGSTIHSIYAPEVTLIADSGLTAIYCAYESGFYYLPKVKSVGAYAFALALPSSDIAFELTLATDTSITDFAISEKAFLRDSSSEMIDTKYTTLITAQGTATADNMWLVDSKEFGPFKAIQIIE